MLEEPMKSSHLGIQRESWMRGPEGVNIIQEEQGAQIQAVQTHLCSESEDFHQHSTTRKEKPHYSRHTDSGTIKERFFTLIKKPHCIALRAIQRTVVQSFVTLALLQLSPANRRLFIFFTLMMQVQGRNNRIISDVTTVKSTELTASTILAPPKGFLTLESRTVLGGRKTA
ncbi:hypothetical protein Anapl_16332 [Anas platyrhynchos]|uniref:Uncharacterized protein n=1 Tax=Anas platyrhynchos TaxID=8839 RepID=R0JL35_ANAPL|nr:hypothetical protein Anapl_16332 [Anas platyrhynchos]